MLSDWKGPSSIGDKGSKKNRRRFIIALLRSLYRRSVFNALPMIALGFLSLILLGSLLLALPVASAGDAPVPWFDALFTSTSAV